MKNFRCTQSFRQGLRYYWYGDRITLQEYGQLSEGNQKNFVMEEEPTEPLDVTKRLPDPEDDPSFHKGS